LDLSGLPVSPREKITPLLGDLTMGSENNPGNELARAMRSQAVKRALKNTESLIRRIAQASEGGLDIPEFREILGSMSLPQLEMFWFYLSSRLTYSETAAVPEWKTREQRSVLRAASDRLNNYLPRDTTGKFIGTRQDIEAHIIEQLSLKALRERESRIAFSRLPLISRVHSGIGISIVYGLYLFLAFGVIFIFVPNIVREFILPLLIGLGLSVAALWYSYLVLGPFRSFIEGKRRNQKKT
jgi:hypothetical protein